MKKVIKRVFIILGIFIIVIVLFGVVYFLKAKSETKKMNSLETQELVENIFSVQDSYVNMFLIKDSTQYIAVDCGNSKDVIADELLKLNISPDAVVAVLLTHTDGDHVAALELFKNAKVYLSEQEEQLINGEKGRFLFFGNRIDAEDYLLVKDQQTFTIGKTKIKGILTPGHTPGSMCYLINDRYLFAGDALSLKEGKIDKFNKMFNMDSERAAKSMEIISGILEAEYIFSAHYGFSNDFRHEGR